jgi:hypothetical protein
MEQVLALEENVSVKEGNQVAYDENMFEKEGSVTQVGTVENMSLRERIEKERIAKQPAIQIGLRSLVKNPSKLNFNLVIQRNLRWTREQKSSLIESVILGYPIPAIYSIKSEDNSLWVLDGKQRLTTLISFCKDEWELSELPNAFGVDITGKKFSELPEEFQEFFDELTLTFYQFERLTIDQRDQLFKRLNSGTPLSAIELTRSILGSEWLEYIDSIAQKPFFEMAALTDNQRDKFVDQELILQVIGLVTGRLNDMSSKHVREFSIDLRVNGMSDDDKKKVSDVFDYLTDAFGNLEEKHRKKILKKNDIIGLAGAAAELMNDIDADTFGRRTASLIVKNTGSYRDTKTSGSAKESNVKKRIQLLIQAVKEE